MDLFFWRWIAIICTGLLVLPAAAQWKDWDYDLDQEKKPWEELQTQLPSYPKAENLLKFDMGSNTANSYFVDAASLSVGDDKVVRYTLVIKTAGGATNVSFEGIRCDGRQLRVYAFGHATRGWSRSRDAGWRDLLKLDLNGHHNVLYRDILCTQTRNRQVAAVKDIISTLKRGGPGVSSY